MDAVAQKMPSEVVPVAASNSRLVVEEICIHCVTVICDID